MRGCALQVVGLSLLFACGDAAPGCPGDGGAEVADVGPARDAATPDAGAGPDVGVGLDVGAGVDAALTGDAGVIGDAGAVGDAGVIGDAGAVGDAGAASDAGAVGDAGTSTIGDRQPVLFVHGINGSSAEFATMMNRLVQDGWPRSRLRAIDFPDPRWGCNIDNAAIVRSEVDMMLLTTGAARVDLVAHSMGAMSTRYFLKNLGGTQTVSTYVTLGGMHHGQRSACLNPLPVCVWQEICPTHEYLTQLNDAPATPGPVHWVSIYSLTDGTVDSASSHLDGAENIEVTGVDHSGANGLTESLLVYPEVKRVLEYPSP